MTTTTYAPARSGHYGLRQAARMEWIKLRSLRSTTYALLLTIVGMITMGVVTMANTKAPKGAEKIASFDPTNNVLAGVALGQLIIGALGVLVITGEYSSGTIRSTVRGHFRKADSAGWISLEERKRRRVDRGNPPIPRLRVL